MKKVVAIIPARGGSKSIPHKNIKDFAGKPLIYWAALAAENSKIVDEILIPTDSEKIKKTVEDFNFKKVKVVKRSAQSSTDKATSESVLIEVGRKFNFSDLIFIQATNPFLKSSDIDSAYALYKKNQYDSLLSGVSQKRFFWKKKNNTAISFNYDYKKRPRRQDFEEYFFENGSFYITSRKNLLKYSNRLSGKIGIYPMHPYSYFELDEPSDWDIAQTLFLKNASTQENVGSILKNIKILALDVDGVFTDGGIYYSQKGEEFVKFSRIDGKGIELFLADKERKIIVISAENSPIVEKRLQKLNITDYALGISSKYLKLKDFIEKFRIHPSQVAFIGDDIQDLEIIDKVGFSACPRDAVEVVKKKVTYICKNNGGQGAIREVVDLILERGTK